MSFIDRIRRLLKSGPAGPADREAGPDAGACAGGAAIPCEEALTLLYEYLDGELPDLPADQVRVHFEICKRCYPHLRLEEAFKEALRRAAEGCDRAPPGLRQRIMDGLSAESPG